MLRDTDRSEVRLEALAARLDLLEAHDAIRQLKAAYMQGLDDRLRGAVAELFWEDAVWESLPVRNPETAPGRPPEAPVSGSRTVGREAIAASFVDAAARMSFTAHFLTNEAITVSGAHATATWKLLQTCTSATGRAFWQAGVYTDDFECRDGVWKFSHLRLALDFRTPHDLGWAAERLWPMPSAPTEPSRPTAFAG